MNEHKNGNGKAWFRTIIVAISLLFITWMTWVTIHLQNYVSGEKRGERLSTVEAELMIERNSEKLRKEFEARLSR
jgi:hypothetical protein